MNWLDKLRGKIGRPDGPVAQGEDKPRQGPDREVGGTVVRPGAKPAPTIEKPGPGAEGEETPRQMSDREAGGTVVRAGAKPGTTIAKPGVRFQPNHEVTADLQIKTLLGSGGMGEVYLARQRQWDVDVAVKVPSDEIVSDPENRHRIVREAEAWTDLGLHPNIAYCYYAQPLGELLLLVIEYVDGGNLRTWIADSRCADLKTGLDLAIQFCHGLEHAHKKGLVHRDIKPENILLNKDGTLKITDFGIVRKLAVGPETLGSSGAVREAAAGMTVAGVGTPEYMAPEQWGEQEGIEGRTDIFAFGVCLYEMLCGARPYPITAGPRQEAADPGRLRGGKGLPERLCGLMKQCVDWDRERRPRTVAEVRLVLCGLYESEFGQPSQFATVTAPSLETGGWNNRAVSQIVLGDGKAAEESWARALQIDSQHLDSLYNLGVSQWRQGRIADDDLTSQLADAGSRQVNPQRAALLQAHVEIERGDHASALELLQNIPADMGASEAILNLRKTLQHQPKLPPGGCVHILKGHRLPVTHLALSKQARVLVSCDEDTVVVWNLDTGSCLRTFEISSWRAPWGSTVLACWLDATGARVGVACRTGFEIWDVQSGRSILKRIDTAKNAESCCFSRDGRRLVYGTFDDTVRTWNLSSDAAPREFQVWSPFNADGSQTVRRITTMSVSGDGRLAFAGLFGFTLFSWNVSAGSLVGTVEGDELEPVVSLSANGRFAASASTIGSSTIELLDPGNCSVTKKLQLGRKTAISGLAMNENGDFLASCDADGRIRLWETGRGRCLRTFDGHAGPAKSVAVSDDGSLVVSGGDDSTVRVWRHSANRLSITARLQISIARPPVEILRTQSVIEGELRAADEAIEGENYERAYHLLQGVRQKTGHGRSPAFRASWGTLLRYSLRNGLSEVWSGRVKDQGHEPINGWGYLYPEKSTAIPCSSGASPGEPPKNSQRVFEGSRLISCTAPSFSRRLLLTGGRDRMAKLWDTATGTCLHELVGHSRVVTSACITADDLHVLTTSADTTGRLWDAISGSCLLVLSGHAAAVSCSSLSEVNFFAVTGSHDGTIRCWNLHTGACEKVIPINDGGPSAVSLFPDGRFMVVGHWNGSVSFWDVQTGECLRTVRQVTSPVLSTGFTWDTNSAVSAHEDRTCCVWNLDWKLVTRAAADWDDAAAYVVERFVRFVRRIKEVDANQFPARRGAPAAEWTDEDASKLFQVMQRCGFGWLRPKGLRNQAALVFDRLEREQRSEQ